MTKRIMVFPCGSEIGLEIFRSLRYSVHFDLVGASSVDDHGQFVFDDYIGALPFHTDPAFPRVLKSLIKEYQIDAIYPAMDAVAETIMDLQGELGIRIIGSSPDVTRICASKRFTYHKLADVVPVPKVFASLSEVVEYPLFIKPDRGYGSRNTLLAHNEHSAKSHLEKSHPDEMVLVEYLPGKEWTVDCFSDRNGELLFHGARLRRRVSNGISVNTRHCDELNDYFGDWARSINNSLRPRGAWFFQAKLDKKGTPKLLEVAARLGGSSSLYRCQGVNFALLSAFDAFDYNVSICKNNYSIEMDRALDNRYRTDIVYDRVYVDLDDCLVIKGKVNSTLVAFLYSAFSEGKRLSLITRHATDPVVTLRRYRLEHLFDEVIHVQDRFKPKSLFIAEVGSIFIDDSNAERAEVSRSLGIPVFSPDMVEALI